MRFMRFPGVALLGALSVAMVGCASGQSTGPGVQGSTGGGSLVARCDMPPQARASGQPSTAPLKIGTLLPETGSLAFLGPPAFAAVDVAVKENKTTGGGGCLTGAKK